jgi:hypothetical protein
MTLKVYSVAPTFVMKVIKEVHTKLAPKEIFQLLLTVSTLTGTIPNKHVLNAKLDIL